MIRRKQKQSEWKWFAECLNRVRNAQHFHFGIQWWALHFIFFSSPNTFYLRIEHIFLLRPPRAPTDRQKTYDVRQIWICGCIAVCASAFVLRCDYDVWFTVDFQLVSKSELYILMLEIRIAVFFCEDVLICWRWACVARHFTWTFQNIYKERNVGFASIAVVY